MTVPENIKSLYPFNSHFFSLTLPQVLNAKIHYIDEGQGETILCLHGNPTWSFFYRNLIKNFRPHYRVIAPDHMGCGLSSKPQNAPYNLKQHIKNTVALIDHLKLEAITLVVHDWGGAIGLGAALEVPHKIKRLVVLNSAAFPSRDVPKRIAFLTPAPFANILIRRLNLFSLSALTLATARGGLHRDVAAGYLYPYHNFHSRIAVASFVKDIPLHSHHPSFHTLANIGNRLSTLKIPTLLAWGAKDFCFHLQFLKQWQEIYPHAQTVICPDAGHYLLEDEPETVFKSLTTFLERS